MEAKSTSKDDYDQVKKDLQQLREDMATLTKTVSESQKGNISSLRDEIRRESRQVLDQAVNKGSEALNQARSVGDKAVHDVEHKVEERPFLSILLMFLAGVLVGKLLDR
ncbi:DUF883 family protein [Marinobacter oulmenensis]|uniref:ElaB/YqjD/DUF883 family membrane-anchored ribosome-binding protein n=1 Tax=Marinobacter oulmenensis TaxID=643747 RepID=A0A840U7K1_9GAMM|nr:hypothetical protein [Marinobacter oulmenensis]MBB5320193.1 ElaB/YqjD/DUF883 family membrane-anchored ribosome-binding protein [Marinobacter oulmenensis]